MGERSAPGLTPQVIAEATVTVLREPLLELGQRIAALEAAVVASLGTTVPPAPVQSAGNTSDSLRRVWGAAPLTSRIAFVRGLLPVEHPLRAVLGEVSGLVDLCAAPAELESWLARYPTLFAEAAAGAVLPPAPLGPDDDLGSLATELLLEIRERVSTILGGLGVTWIVPAAGDPVITDYEVVGEEPSSELSSGRITRVRRPGFRRLGRLELSAQVIVAGSGASPQAAAPPVETWQRVAPSSSPSVGIGGGPEWLQLLRGQTGGQAAPEAQRCLDVLGRVAQAGRSASDADVAEAFGPLLAWLGTGWGSAGPLPAPWLEALAPYRTQLLAWLAAELSAELVVAAERDGFEPDAMEGVGERRTAHPHERGTVARLQAPGLRREGRVLLRARVIRYESGGAR
jgi:hypothetical protein